MAVSDSYIEFVIEQLAQFRGLLTKRMFGGVGIYADDLFFALIDDDRLYFKVDDQNRSDYEDRGCRPFSPTGDPSQVMQYYEVPIDIIEDRNRLPVWADRALDVARRARERKRRK